MADSGMSSLPPYEGVGSRSTFPGPFACRDATMHTHVLDGDLSRITELVERTLTRPAAGAVTYRPLGRRVLLMYGPNTVSSLDEQWRDSGEVLEHLAAFWVPVAAGTEHNGRFVPDRLCMTVPHILVDNPISLVVGREVYGFPKALGRFTYGAAGGLAVECYGGDFIPGERAGWRPLLEVEPSPADSALADDEPVGLSEFVSGAAAALVDGFDADAEGFDIPGGVRFAARLCRDILAGRSNMVFLKQFRDAREQERACYQRVVEVPVKTRSVKPVLSLRDWNVTVRPLVSHPIADDLGVASQPASWSGELRNYSFDVQLGNFVGP